jgi:hypothetical protein
MAITYKAIATVTVGSGGASTISFSSIPATYTDLVVKVSARTNNPYNQDWLLMMFNNSNSSLKALRLSGTGSSADSSSNTGSQIWGATAVGATATASTFSNADIYVPNYTSSNYKSWSTDTVNEINATGTEVITNLFAGLWSSTAAITTVTLTPFSAGTIQQYSTATLYGIKNS